jgi:hypothetical protein
MFASVDPRWAAKLCAGHDHDVHRLPYIGPTGVFTEITRLQRLYKINILASLKCHLFPWWNEHIAYGLFQQTHPLGQSTAIDAHHVQFTIRPGLQQTNVYMLTGLQSCVKLVTSSQVGIN